MFFIQKKMNRAYCVSQITYWALKMVPKQNSIQIDLIDANQVRDMTVLQGNRLKLLKA